MFIKSLSIKLRLLIAVTALALSTLIIGMSSWYWLSRSNTILEELHNTTLSEVNRSHELTKQSSLFTTSAPFLLNLRSSYLVESEGNKLLNSIDAAIASWETREVRSDDGTIYSAEILSTLAIMRESMASLIDQTRNLSDRDDDTRAHAANLVKIDRKIESILLGDLPMAERDSARQAQLAVNALITATHATSLLSLGEYQRRFLKKTQTSTFTLAADSIKEIVEEIHVIAHGADGLFHSRSKVLQYNVSARRLLSRISANAGELNFQVLSLIQKSESEIARRREETTAHIGNAKILVVLFGLGSIFLSLISAFYISGYLIKRLNTITTTMTGLASGDLNMKISDEEERQDELSALQHAFNIFHANALKHNRLNKELIQKTALFESTFNNITDGVAITNVDGKILAFNPKLNQLFSRFGSKKEASIGCSLSGKIDDVSGEILKSHQSQDNAVYKELRNSLGHVLEIRTSVLPDGGGVWLFSDTTERRRIEERLQHFHRLESLGQLTGEVAHDFNNILTAVKATLSSVLSSRKNEEAHRLAVDKIDDAVDIGNALTQRLLAFAKKQRLEPKIVEINDLVNGVSELISLSLGNQIELEINSSHHDVFAYIDPLQLESALLNLCMNSAHAIDGKGRIQLNVEESTNDMLSIHVLDNGCGMSSEIADRAVEPFYSTRRGRSGTGLGLSIVYGFVKQSGGDMQITSEINKGTTVSLNLLKSKDNTDPIPRSCNNVAKSGYSVLIVEDDIDTLTRAVEMLENACFQVTTARSLNEANSILKKGASFSLLFTDLHLGGVDTGWALVELCLQRNSAEKIIVTSGRLSELAKPPLHLDSACIRLEKPYDLADIVNVML